VSQENTAVSQGTYAGRRSTPSATARSSSSSTSWITLTPSKPWAWSSPMSANLDLVRSIYAIGNAGTLADLGLEE